MARASRPHDGTQFNRYAQALSRAAIGAVFSVMLAGQIASGTPAIAQDAQDQAYQALLGPGDAVVTGFSGSTREAAYQPVALGAGSANNLFIDLNGASVRVLRLGGAAGGARGQIIDAAPIFEVMAGQVGQVFGIALDDGGSNEQNAPNIYVAASSAFGIRIVTPDENGDGIPERRANGTPGAEFMAGQFGMMEGSGPGTIYRIDGLTGEVSVFTTLGSAAGENSGPGLGNIAYDPRSQQIFASDFDTGAIFRIGMDGQPIDSFDHGTAGRSAAGLEPIPDDGLIMEIDQPTFDATDPQTWGLTPPERRVWGLTVHKSRLYYAVWAGPEIWSVGISEDGSFAGDARQEFVVEGDGGEVFPVSDMVFDGAGQLYLAQRGGLVSDPQDRIFAEARHSKVLRYRPDNPSASQAVWSWRPVPEIYSIGFPEIYANASGGIDLGYSVDGNPSDRKCDYLWSTGDALRVSAHAELPGEPVVHGLQGNALELVQPANMPPRQAVFADYDGRFSDPEKEGHVGDVEILRTCASGNWHSGFKPIPVHTRSVSHWKHGSNVHSKTRSHWKSGSSAHLKWRSHSKHGSHGHTKWKSHWKNGSYVHSKTRSHWKYGSRLHTKTRSHWKHGSREHSKLRSHWKYGSREHTKERSHWKHGSREHSKERSHWKHGSREHSKERSHWKHGSREHSKRRSHWKVGSNTHVQSLSHLKKGSSDHSKRRSHARIGSSTHSRSVSTHAGGKKGASTRKLVRKIKKSNSNVSSGLKSIRARIRRAQKRVQ